MNQDMQLLLNILVFAVCVTSHLGISYLNIIMQGFVLWLHLTKVLLFAEVSKLKLLDFIENLKRKTA